VDHSSNWSQQAGDQPAEREQASPFAPPLPTDDVLRQRLADELDYARRMIDVMGDTLSADSAVVMRYTVQLQTVDIVGQMLGHIAAIVRSRDPDEAIDRIGMCELKARLQRRTRL
jgi:hypothetical protein